LFDDHDLSFMGLDEVIGCLVDVFYARSTRYFQLIHNKGEFICR